MTSTEPRDPFLEPPAGTPVSLPQQPPQAPHEYVATAPYFAPQLEAPTGLAKGLIGVTGAVAGLYVLSAITAAQYVSAVRTRDPLSLNLTAHEWLSLLFVPTVIAAFVMFGLWMHAVRKNMDAQSVHQGLHRSFAWWGWVIPLANLVLPYKYMKDLNATSHVGGLGNWWGLYLVGAFVSNYGSNAVGFDGTVNTAVLDTYVATQGFAAIAIVASWLFLRRIVNQITTLHILPTSPHGPRAEQPL